MSFCNKEDSIDEDESKYKEEDTKYTEGNTDEDETKYKEEGSIIDVKEEMSHIKKKKPNQEDKANEEQEKIAAIDQAYNIKNLQLEDEDTSIEDGEDDKDQNHQPKHELIRKIRNIV